MLRKMLIGAAALIVLMAAPAAAQYYVVVTPTDVLAGGVVSVSGKGCGANSKVYVRFQRITPPRQTIYSKVIRADAKGNFTFKITVPKNAKPGTYRLQARCRQSGSEKAGDSNWDAWEKANPKATSRAIAGQVRGEWLYWEAIVTVRAAPAGGPGTGNGTIVRTGSNLNGLGLVGAGLVATGGIILLGARNRRRYSHA